MEAFLYGYDVQPVDGLALQSWASVGASTGVPVDIWKLGEWRKVLATKFRAVGAWLSNFVSEHMVVVQPDQREWPPNPHAPVTWRFDSDSYAEHIAEVIRERLAIIHRLATLSISDTIGADGKSSKIVGVLPTGEIVLETSARGVIRDQMVSKLEREVTEKLASAFGGDIFEFTIQPKETL